MLRALRAMPNSSGGTPSTRAWQRLRLVTIVTSCAIGGGAGGSNVAGSCAPAPGADGAAGGTVCRSAIGIMLRACRPRGVLYDLDRRIGCEQRIDIVRQIVIGLAPLILAFFPPNFHDADFGEQRILDEGIEDEKTGILLHEDVVDVVGLLFRGWS